MTASDISQRALTVEEWQRRLNTARNLLDGLDTEVAKLIAWTDRAGDATGATKAERLDAIHSAAGKLGSLRGQIQLAQRRIDRGLT